MDYPTLVGPPPRHKFLPSGTVLDERFRIDGLVGRGGMATVYRATHLALGKQVAVKVPSHVHDEPRFQREARSLARVEHPNVCRIFDVGESAGRPFLVMELLAGQTVAGKLMQGALPIREALEIARRVLEALTAVHEAGLVHRDVKPANVMITEPDSCVKLLDFGLAKSSSPAEAITDVTSTGVVVGTPQYMSPEAMRGRPLDARSDVYSVGTLLFHMLAGELPFEGEPPLLYLRVARGEHRNLADVGSAVPLEVQEIVARALAPEPDRRFPSASSFRRAIVLSDAYMEPDTRVQEIVPRALDFDSVTQLYTPDDERALRSSTR